ncbi:MAG: hypothetical protein ACKOE5_12800, partial [Cytophagales bacterium]
MQKLSLIAVIAVFFVCSNLDGYSQIDRKLVKRNNRHMSAYTGKKKFSRQNVYSGVGVSLNAMNYFGDLSPMSKNLSTDFSFTKPSFGISFFHRYGPRYSLQAQYMYGALEGSDSQSA